MSESGSPPAGAKSRRMSRTIASGLHTLFRAQLSTDQWCSVSTCWCQGSLRPSLRSLSVCPRAVACCFHQRRTVSRVGLLHLPRLQQRRRRVDAGQMDRRWIHIPRCHGDRIGDRCSSTARAGLVRVRRDPDCDRRRLLRGRPVHRRVPALPCRAAQPPGRRDRLSCSCHVDRCFGARILT